MGRWLVEDFGGGVVEARGKCGHDDGEGGCQARR